MNLRGTGEALMFFSFFVIVAVIAAGIFWNVLAFYGQPYDFRSVHAELLGSHVSECLKEKGFSLDFNLSLCGIYVSAEDADYLIYINNSEGKVFVSGVSDYLTQCELAEKNNEYARCVKGSVVNEGKRVDYIVGVNRMARRIT